MAYKSDTNIQLGQIPALDPLDVRMLPVLQPIHNAIHALNASAVGFKDFLLPPGPDDPAEAGFLNKIPSFWAVCKPGVTEGKIVVCAKNGWQLGVIGAHYSASGVALDGNSSVKETWPTFGLVAEGPLEDGRCRILWPPFLLKIEGVTVEDMGKRIYTDGHGELFIPAERKNEDWAVGLIVHTDTVIIAHRLFR